jgi:drug/metabolite transporter (DMT)-like permease
MLGILTALGTASTFTACAIINRRLSQISPFVICLYHGTIGLCLIAIASVIMSIKGSPPTIFNHSWTILLKAQFSGYLDAIAVFATVIAFMSDSSGFVSLISYMQVVYAFAYDAFWFGETFNSKQLMSALSILAVTVTVVWIKLQVKNKTG